MSEPLRRTCLGNSNEDTRDIKSVLDSDHPINIILVAEGGFYYPRVMNSEVELIPCPHAYGNRKDRCCANKEKIGYCYWVRGR